MTSAYRFDVHRRKTLPHVSRPKQEQILHASKSRKPILITPESRTHVPEIDACDFGQASKMSRFGARIDLQVIKEGFAR